MTPAPVRTQDMSQRLDTSDDSCICDQPDLPAKDCSGRKRKCHAKDVHSASPSASIGMDTKSRQTDEGNSKRPKASDGTKEKVDSKGKVEESNSGHTVESSPKQMKDNAKPSLVPAKQDYIHVRARRGQATDSHSLAERVRREKISERMKFLQELVPGCSKITGKAVMLDEIINYVQALQHQVEFLSMKLAAVNARMDFNVEGESLSKDMFQQHCSFIGQPFGPDTSAAYPQLQKSHMQIGFDPHVEGHSMGNLAEVEVAKMGSAQFPCINGYNDPVSQISNVWNDDLQCAFPRGLEQNRPTSFTSQGVHGHMKIEL